MNEKNVIKIVISVIVIALGVLAFYLLKPTKPKLDKEFGSVTLIIINDETLFEEELSFSEEMTLFDLLDNNFEITTQDSGFGKFLLAIKGSDFEIVSDSNTSYLGLFELVDGKNEYLMTGIEGHYLIDGTTLIIELILL